MSLPESWIDELLRRLKVRYGAAFQRQYETAGVPPADVRADWAQLLHGLSGDAIAFGLANLPADRPPNAGQFRALCLAMPRPAMPALPPPSPDGIRRMAAVLRPLKRDGVTFHELLAQHRGRRDRGEPLSLAQRAWLTAAERKVGVGDEQR